MDSGYLNLVAGQIGVPIFLLVAIVIWSEVWKVMALWKAGRKNSLAWFIVLALVNTIGILDILYIYVFSEMKHKGTARRKRRR